MSGFRIFKDCKYARVLNFEGYTGFTYLDRCDRVLNICRGTIMERFSTFQDSVHTSFRHMQALHKVLNMAEYA